MISTEIQENDRQRSAKIEDSAHLLRTEDFATEAKAKRETPQAVEKGKKDGLASKELRARDAPPSRPLSTLRPPGRNLHKTAHQLALVRGVRAHPAKTNTPDRTFAIVFLRVNVIGAFVQKITRLPLHRVIVETTKCDSF